MAEGHDRCERREADVPNSVTSSSTATAARRFTEGRPPRPRGFLAAAASFVVVFAAGATPIPLYGTYRDAGGVDDAQLSLVAVGYFICAVAALLVLGRLSDHVGRRPTSIAALVIAALGCVVLTDVHGVGMLLLGRALQGLAAGLAASAIAAFAVDTAPAKPRWVVSTVTSSGTNVGLAIGAFGAGALVDIGPAPRVLSYWISFALLAVCVVLVLLAPETTRRTPGALRSLRPQLRLPAAARRYLPAGAAILVATWALGGYYQSFGPSVAADDLGSSNALVAAAVFASYLAPSALGGALAGRLLPATAQRLGMGAVTLAAAGLITAISLESAALFVAAGAVGGIGMGVATSATLRALLPEAGPGERAGLLALVYVVSYVGAAVPSLIAGQLSRSVSLLGITIGYSGLALVAFVIALATARNPQRR